jgi:hypothetical protein
MGSRHMMTKCCKCKIENEMDISKFLCDECIVMTALTILKKDTSKQSKWYRYKKFAYWTLLYVPIPTYIDAKYGVTAQCLYIAGTILMICIDDITSWLSDKF